MLTRREMEQEVKALALRASEEHPDVSAVLHGLGASIAGGRTVELMCLVATWARGFAAEINRRN